MRPAIFCPSWMTRKHGPQLLPSALYWARFRAVVRYPSGHGLEHGSSLILYVVLGLVCAGLSLMFTDSLFGLWTARLFPSYTPRSLHFPWGTGTLGHAVPAATGVTVPEIVLTT